MIVLLVVHPQYYYILYLDSGYLFFILFAFFMQGKLAQNGLIDAEE